MPDRGNQETSLPKERGKSPRKATKEQTQPNKAVERQEKPRAYNPVRVNSAWLEVIGKYPSGSRERETVAKYARTFVEAGRMPSDIGNLDKHLEEAIRGVDSEFVSLGAMAAPVVEGTIF